MERVSVISGRGDVECAAVIALAGLAAERRARRLDGDGFRLWIGSRRHMAAIHEAGHAVAAAALGRKVFRATIRADREIKVGPRNYSGGYVLSGKTDTPIAVEKPTEADRDERKAARLSLLLARELSWREGLRTMRELRERSRELIDRNWLQVVVFASVLMERETVDQQEAERFLRGCA